MDEKHIFRQLFTYGGKGYVQTTVHRRLPIGDCSLSTPSCKTDCVVYKECDQRTVYRLLRTSDRVSDIMYRGFCTDYDQQSAGSGLHIRDSRA